MSEDSDKTAAAPFPELDSTRTVTGRERRVQQRFPFTAEAEVTELRSQARVTGRCSDLGPGGCYVDTLTPLPVGTEVRISVTRDTRKFEAEAVVTYAHPSLGMGLKFTEISGEYQQLLDYWITVLGGRMRTKKPMPPTGAGAATDDGTNMLIVLNQLITLLIRKKILTENEGAEFLGKMFH